MEARSSSSWQEAKGARGRRRSTGEQAATDLFRALDKSNAGFIYESQMRPIWAALARHVQEGSASVFLRQLQERTTPISRGEWTSVMDALESIVGVRLFRTLMRGAETLLAELESSSMQMRARNQVEAIEWNVRSRRGKRKEDDLPMKASEAQLDDETLPLDEEEPVELQAEVQKSTAAELPETGTESEQEFLTTLGLEAPPGTATASAKTATSASSRRGGQEKQAAGSSSAKAPAQEAPMTQQSSKLQPKFKAEPKSNTGPKQRRKPEQASAPKEKDAPKADAPKTKTTCKDASTNTDPSLEGRLGSNPAQAASNTGPKQGRRGKGELTKSIAKEGGPPGDQAAGTGAEKETSTPAKPKAPPALPAAPPAPAQVNRQQHSPLSRSQSEPWLPSSDVVLKEQEQVAVREPAASSLPVIPPRKSRVNDPVAKKKPAKEKDAEPARRNSSTSIVQVPKEKRSSYQELRVKLDEGRKELTKQRQQVKDLERMLQDASRRDKPHYGITQGVAYRTPVVPEPQERQPVRKLVVLPRLPGHSGGYPDSVSELSLAKFGVASGSAHVDQTELEPHLQRDQSPEEHERLALAAREDNKVVAMSRRERSRARTQAIIELGNAGEDTWDLRKAEKASRLVDLNTFSEAMWGSFFEWKADLEIDIT